MNNNQNNADRRPSERQAARLTAPIDAPNQMYGEDISFGDNTSLGVDMPIGLDISDIAPAGVGADHTPDAAQVGMPGLYGVDMTADVHANLADALGEHRYPIHDDDHTCASCSGAKRSTQTRQTSRNFRTARTPRRPHAVPSWHDQVEWPEYADPADDPLGDQEVDPDLTMADILINLEAYTEPHRTHLDPHTHPAFYVPSTAEPAWASAVLHSTSPFGIATHPAFPLLILLNPLGGAFFAPFTETELGEVFDELLDSPDKIHDLDIDQKQQILELWKQRHEAEFLRLDGLKSENLPYDEDRYKFLRDQYSAIANALFSQIRTAREFIYLLFEVMRLLKKRRETVLCGLGG